MRRSLALPAALLLLASGSAAAATCTVDNATLAFGTYNPVSAAPTTATAVLTVSCADLLGAGSSATVSYSIQISGGNAGSTASRELRMAGNALPYNLYTAGTFATVWDDTTGVSGSVLLQGPLGLPVLVTGTDSKTVHGRILAQRPAVSGVYADSLLVTVNY